MCGRIACLLDPEVICRACSYKDGKGKGNGGGQFRKPRWRDHPPSKDGNTSYKYYPSANISPTKFTPVMVRGDSPLMQGEEEGEVVIQPMMFGLIPVFHKGEEPSKHGFSTNNARIEGIQDSRMYKPILNKRQCCVIVMQAFYEWKSVGAQPKKQKQPFLIFAPQEKDVKVADDAAWNSAEWDEEKGWKGPKILKVAGIFDVWNSPKGDKVYSYTIITMDANKTLNWLHDRMPAILEREEQVMAWLNATPKTDTKELMSILKPANHLQWYMVDPKVGNSRCHDLDCVQPFESKEAEPNALQRWLQQSSVKPKKRETKKEDRDDEEDAPEKKIKAT